MLKKVLFFGEYDNTFGFMHARQRILKKSLKKIGIQIADCALSPILNSAPFYFKGIFKFLISYVINNIRLFIRTIQVKDYEVMIVGMASFHFMPLARILTKIKRKPLIYDPAFSLYDTLVFNKPKAIPGSLKSSIYYLYDKISLKLSDLILLDTDAHIDYLSAIFEIKKEKFRKIPLGAEEDIFYPRPNKGNCNNFVVLFYGITSKMHGFEYIIEAAKLLEEYDDIKIKIIGWIQPEYKKLIEKLNPKNLILGKPVDYSNSLPREIADCDLCLGIFGSTIKAKNVISQKEYQALAMRKPLLTHDRVEKNEFFIHKENVFLCKGQDAEAIKDGILSLKQDKELRERIAENGYKTFQEVASYDRTGKLLKDIINEAINNSSSF